MLSPSSLSGTPQAHQLKTHLLFFHQLKMFMYWKNAFRLITNLKRTQAQIRAESWLPGFDPKFDPGASFSL
jgi:hypothetical protein